MRSSEAHLRAHSGAGLMGHPPYICPSPGWRGHASRRAGRWTRAGDRKEDTKRNKKEQKTGNKATGKRYKSGKPGRAVVDRDALLHRYTVAPTDLRLAAHLTCPSMPKSGVASKGAYGNDGRPDDGNDGVNVNFASRIQSISAPPHQPG